MPLNLSKTPVLYLYGTDKKIMFDDEQVREHVRREGKKPGNKSAAIAVDNAGHWLYRHREDVCIDHVKKFILSTGTSWVEARWVEWMLPVVGLCNFQSNKFPVFLRTRITGNKTRTVRPRK